MRQFVQRFARSAFGIGVAIGLMVNTLIHESMSKAIASSAPNSTDICSNPPPDLPPALQSFVDIQCQVRQAIFADQIDPSVA